MTAFHDSNRVLTRTYSSQKGFNSPLFKHFARLILPPFFFSLPIHSFLSFSHSEDIILEGDNRPFLIQEGRTLKSSTILPGTRKVTSKATSRARNLDELGKNNNPLSKGQTRYKRFRRVSSSKCLPIEISESLSPSFPPSPKKGKQLSNLTLFSFYSSRIFKNKKLYKFLLTFLVIKIPSI